MHYYANLYIQTYLFFGFTDYDDSREGEGITPFMLSWRDTAELFRLGLEIKLTDLPSRFEVFYISADLPHEKFKFDKVKEVLGFISRDNFERMWHKK